VYANLVIIAIIVGKAITLSFNKGSPM
jgi:hypothetical protein